ncbi:MAG: hypothetical protein ABIA75_06285 [Candidatus Neomarinimicrobiota bacterium]
MNIIIIKTNRLLHSIVLITLMSALLLSAGYAAEGKWIKVGNLHNFYQAHGCEPEEDFGTTQQFGMRWPAFYDLQDMQAARGFWIGVKDYYDPQVDYTFPYKVAHCGPRPRTSIEVNEMMPVEFKLVARNSHPYVYVDGNEASDMQYGDLVDEYDQDLLSDRMIYNFFHTSTGISVERKIYAFSEQNNDNYFIYDYKFINTGICLADSSLTHNATLEGVYFYWQYRNAVCYEGTVEGPSIDWLGHRGWGTIRDTRWGKNTMNEVLGEKPLSPAANDVYDDQGNLIRCFYSWHGLHSEYSYDNIGSPNYQGYQPDGRLGASQYTGVVTLYADKAPNNRINDQSQPSTTMYIGSDEPETQNNDQFSQSRMDTEYNKYIAAGHPAKSQAEEVGTGYANQYGTGSYSQGIGFGPYTFAPGDTIRIVLAEGAAGLNRKMNTEVGGNWFKKKALGENVTMELPDGTITTDENLYKDTWVYTGVDSIIQTFRRALTLFDNDLILPQPPEPPMEFNVTSQGSRIYLTWAASINENDSFFEGYKIFRAKGALDSAYYEIFNCNKIAGNLTHEYSDLSAERGQKYFYYIVSYDDGTRNSINPGQPLCSSLFYTRTNEGATLKKPPAPDIGGIRIVPNPFNIRNPNLQYIGEQYKIMFLNLPVACEIKIFTERGDLIKTIQHEGSGDNYWDLLTDSRQIVVSGVYIATFEEPNGSSTYRKFVIIR